MSQWIKNFLLFKLGWIGIVAGAATGYVIPGTLIAVLAIAEHLRTASRRSAEIRLLALALIAGITWETALVSTGVLQYPGPGGLNDAMPPAWIVVLWALFATTLNNSLAWLKQHWSLAAIGGALGGPMAFWAGAQMGAVSFPVPVLALTVLAIGWALLLPLLVQYAQWLDSVDATRVAGEPS